MIGAGIFSIALPTLILVAGVVDDLRSRKIHNWLVLTLLVLTLTAVVFVQGWSGLKLGLLGMGTALIIALPLVLLKAFGAGDMKLLMVFGLATEINAVLMVGFYSLIWGALLGVTRSLLQGQGLALLMNTISVATRKDTEKAKLHTIPYSVALLFGWLTYLSLEGVLL